MFDVNLTFKCIFNNYKNRTRQHTFLLLSLLSKHSKTLPKAPSPKVAPSSKLVSLVAIFPFFSRNFPILSSRAICTFHFNSRLFTTTDLPVPINSFNRKTLNIEPEIKTDSSPSPLEKITYTNDSPAYLYEPCFKHFCIFIINKKFFI